MDCKIAPVMQGHALGPNDQSLFQIVFHDTDLPQSSSSL